ncbi:hypothetical protein [Sphingobacterium sp. LRF_L2]|uniref:hypothetical protein n=1 Tax=Sphingobacterium sp. LRF_L2 TaxID=3369421 RepID=UPI003F5F6AD4
MLKATKRIVIISERVNKQGFRTLVDGVDRAQYDLNPILLWMHQRAFGSRKDVFLPLGNVIELKVEDIDGVGKCLAGLPVFDDTDEFAVSIYNKYENGTIRMASAGLIPTEWSEEADLIMHGQRGATLVRSILEEISMVDIGADNNALSIALYDQEHNRIELSSAGGKAVIPLLKSDNQIDMEKIELSAAKAAAILGEAEIKNNEQFETKIMGVVQLAARQKTKIESLTREKDELQAKLDEKDRLELSSKVEALVQGAVDARKITADDKPTYIELATANYASVEKLLGDKKGNQSLVTAIEESKDKAVTLYAGKTWDQLDKEGNLVKLKSADINLFKQLFEEKYGTPYEK